MFWQLFIQQFSFHTRERTSKLNIINPTDNGRKTPPLRCYISSQALSVQLDMKPLISPRYIRSWSNMCLALILIFTVDILWVIVRYNSFHIRTDIHKDVCRYRENIMIEGKSCLQNHKLKLDNIVYKHSFYHSWNSWLIAAYFWSISSQWLYQKTVSQV